MTDPDTTPEFEADEMDPLASQPPMDDDASGQDAKPGYRDDIQGGE